MRWLVLSVVLWLSSCSAVDRNGIEQVKKTNDIILPQYLEYVQKDATLKPEEMEDRKKLVESLRRLVEALRKSAGGDE